MKRKDTVPITLRIPRPWLDMADALAEEMRLPGRDTDRSDAFRAIIEYGFGRLKREKEDEGSTTIDVLSFHAKR